MNLRIRPYRIDDNIMFGSALFILFAVIVLGLWRDDVSYSVPFMVALSLSCSMVFAFLPFSAEMENSLVRAGGTAAIFCVCLFLTVPFAKEMLKDDHNRAAARELRAYEDLINIQQNQIIKDKNEQIEQLRRNINDIDKLSSDKSALSGVISGNINQISGSLSETESSLNEFIRLAKAAQSNYSDSRTCSQRAGESINAAAPAVSKIIEMKSLLKNAQAYLPKS